MVKIFWWKTIFIFFEKMFHYWRLRDHATEFRYNQWITCLERVAVPVLLLRRRYAVVEGFRLLFRVVTTDAAATATGIESCVVRFISFRQHFFIVFPWITNWLGSVLGVTDRGTTFAREKSESRSIIGVTRAHGNSDTRCAIITKKIPFTTVASRLCKNENSKPPQDYTLEHNRRANSRKPNELRKRNETFPGVCRKQPNKCDFSTRTSVLLHTPL